MVPHPLMEIYYTPIKTPYMVPGTDKCTKLNTPSLKMGLEGEGICICSWSITKYIQYPYNY